MCKHSLPENECIEAYEGTDGLSIECDGKDKNCSFYSEITQQEYKIKLRKMADEFITVLKDYGEKYPESKIDVCQLSIDGFVYSCNGATLFN